MHLERGGRPWLRATHWIFWREYSTARRLSLHSPSHITKASERREPERLYVRITAADCWE